MNETERPHPHGHVFAMPPPYGDARGKDGDVIETDLPIIVAPMAGGASTPALVLAAAEAGALGFVAAGYRTASDLERELRELRAATSHPFGVNVFVPGPRAGDPDAVTAYARE